MQCQSTQQLFVEMTHVQNALARFPHCCERFDQQSIQRFTVARSLPEYFSARAQIRVAQFLHLGLDRIDGMHRVRILAQQTIVATAEYFLEKAIDHCSGCPQSKRGGDACPHPSAGMLVVLVQPGT